mmetsp:Transcript_10812/g.32248  ORF Transcript_10812/g.32248 Transcript_10812/m.32248 type:complete len:84 (+) Transcript_10812:348-599(+)
MLVLRPIYEVICLVLRVILYRILTTFCRSPLPAIEVEDKTMILHDVALDAEALGAHAPSGYKISDVFVARVVRMRCVYTASTQ